MITREQDRAVRAAKADLREAVHLGVDPEWLYDQLWDELDGAAQDYAHDTGRPPTARPD